jgi:hypothetical protein
MAGMGDFLPPVVFELRAVTGQFQAKMAEAKGELTALEATGASSGARFATALKFGLIGGAVALGAISAIAVHEANKLQEAQTRLKTALEAQHRPTERIMGAVEALSVNYRSLGFGADDVTDAYGRLEIALQDPTKAMKLMGVTADYARFKHMDLASAARIMARASQGSARAFKELGISMDTSIKDPTARANKAFAELTKRLGGQAQAYTKTFAGTLQVLKTKLQAAFETLGTKLLPALQSFGEWLNNVVLPALQGFIDGLTGKNGLAKGFSDSARYAFNFGKVIIGVFKIAWQFKDLLLFIGGLLVTMWIGSKIYAGIQAIVSALKIVRGAFVATEAAADAVVVAEAAATGGFSLVAAGIAATAAIALVGGIAYAVTKGIGTTDTGGDGKVKVPTGLGGLPADYKPKPPPDLSGGGGDGSGGDKNTPRTKAADALKALKQQIADYKKNVRDNLTAGSDVVSLQQTARAQADELYQKMQSDARARVSALGGTSEQADAVASNIKKPVAQSIVSAMKGKVSKLKTFYALLRRLMKKGLHNSVLQQLIAAGPDGGISAAQEILGLGVEKINSQDYQIGAWAAKISNLGAKLEYGSALKTATDNALAEARWNATHIVKAVKQASTDIITSTDQTTQAAKKHATTAHNDHKHLATKSDFRFYEWNKLGNIAEQNAKSARLLQWIKDHANPVTPIVTPTPTPTTSQSSFTIKLSVGGKELSTVIQDAIVQYERRNGSNGTNHRHGAVV